MSGVAGLAYKKKTSNEPQCMKKGLRGFRPGPTQTRLYSHTKFRFRKDRLALSVERKQRRTCTADLQFCILFSHMQILGFLVHWLINISYKKQNLIRFLLYLFQ